MVQLHETPAQEPLTPGDPVGAPTQTFVDYFAFQEDVKFHLPDGKQYFVFG